MLFKVALFSLLVISIAADGNTSTAAETGTGTAETTAGTTTEQDPSVVCKLPEEVGVCKAMMPRYRYDPSSGKCVQFIYGGCGGNGNNFKSENDCLKFCQGVQ